MKDFCETIATKELTDEVLLTLDLYNTDRKIKQGQTQLYIISLENGDDIQELARTQNEIKARRLFRVIVSQLRKEIEEQDELGRVL
jgi:hypothetical protein